MKIYKNESGGSIVGLLGKIQVQHHPSRHLPGALILSPDSHHVALIHNLTFGGIFLTTGLFITLFEPSNVATEYQESLCQGCQDVAY